MKLTKVLEDGEIEFTCPKCQHHQLEEIVVNAEVATDMKMRLAPDREGGISVTYGHHRMGEGDTERYQCVFCGFMICHEDGDPVTDTDELGKWLQNTVGVEEQLLTPEDEDLND